MSEKIYGLADKAWQVVVGCSPSMKCAPRCWARRTVERIVKCQETSSPFRAEFFRQALTPDLQQWSGEVFLDADHLNDPLRWTRPALIATGFHGDWGRLSRTDMLIILRFAADCPQHKFMMLTKQPDAVVRAVTPRWWWKFGDGRFVPLIPMERGIDDSRFLPNVTIGCSVMSQIDANQMRRPMEDLSLLGWDTHVWYEPAIGPVSWEGWEFLKLHRRRGVRGGCAAVRRWMGARTIRWCRDHHVACFVKQLGSHPHDDGTLPTERLLRGRKGGDPSEWPLDLRVRENPLEVRCG